METGIAAGFLVIIMGFTVVRHRDGVIGKMKYEHRGNSLSRRI